MSEREPLGAFAALDLVEQVAESGLGVEDPDLSNSIRTHEI
jgi:hypothetical protein